MIATDRALLPALAVALLTSGCGTNTDEPDPIEAGGPVVITFNTGTSESMGHDNVPDDGYGSAEAVLSDQHYGDGLAWSAVVDDTRRFFEQIRADVVAFQEIFYSGDCATIPESAHGGFICETWQPGDPVVAQVVLGLGWQVACNLGKPDKCAAVHERFGAFRGCAGDLCLDGLDGAEVAGCGSGSRIGRGVIELAAGGELTLVTVHGSSGASQEDQDCRAQQFAQVFVDLGLGDGEPAANGERNLILGDLNTDPGRTTDLAGAMVWNGHVGEGERFHFISAVGPTAAPSYAGLFNIDHVVSDALGGSCWVAGLTEGHPPVSDVVYFDHKPVMCTITSGL